MTHDGEIIARVGDLTNAAPESDLSITPVDNSGGGAAVEGFVTQDLSVDFDGRWTGCQLLVELDTGSIYQDAAGGVTPPTDFIVGLVPSAAFDTFVAAGGATSGTSETFSLGGGAVDLGASPTAQFDAAGINQAWNPPGGAAILDRTDFVTARVTLSADATGTWKFLVSSGGEMQTYEGPVSDGQIRPEPLEAPSDFSMAPVDNSGGGDAVEGFVTQDLSVDFDGRWTGCQLLVELDTGSIYQDAAGGVTPPTDFIVGLVPSAAFDTFVAAGGATSGTSETFSLGGGAVDLGASPTAQFDAAGINQAWNPPGGAAILDRTDFVTARVTLSADATGTWKFLVSSGGEMQTYEGSISDGEMIPEPTGTAGILFRESLTADAAYAGIFVSPAGSIRLQSRSGSGDNVSGQTEPGTLPGWLKLERDGEVIRGYVSADGSDWAFVGEQSVSLPDTAHVGLGVASETEVGFCTAEFDSILVSRVSDADSPVRDDFFTIAPGGDLVCPVLDNDDRPVPNEPGLDGCVIELMDRETGEVVATTLTESRDLNGDGIIDPFNESGLYSFTGLEEGLYDVQAPAGDLWVQTTPFNGGAGEAQEFVVNAYEPFDQSAAHVACNAGGDGVLLWRGYTESGGNSRLRAQRFGPDGNLVGELITVTEEYSYGQSRVAVGEDGRFIVAWGDRYSEDGSYWMQGYVRVFGADGSPLTDAIAVDDTPLTYQTLDDLQIDESGDFIVAWEQRREGACGVYLRRFHADGTPKEETFAAWEDAVSYEYYEVDLEAVGADQTAVVWRRRGYRGLPPMTALRILGPDGQWDTDVIVVDEGGTDSQYSAPKAMAVGDSQVLIKYDRSTRSYLRTYNLDGVPADDASEIDVPDMGYLFGSRVCRHASGAMALVDYQYGNKIVMLEPDGEPMGPAVEVYYRDTFDWLTFLPDGRVLVTWTGYDSDDSGVLAKVFPGITDDFVFHMDLARGEVREGVDFGQYEINTAISGQAYEDTDGDGTRDAAEGSLNGWTVQLVENSTDEVLAETVTDDVDLDGDGTIDPQTQTGLYRFTAIEPGTYRVRIVGRDNWAVTGPAAGAHEYTLSSGDVVGDGHFGLAQYGSISGVVFADLNSDAARGPDEPGVNDWELKLYDLQGTGVIATTNTAGVDVNGDGEIDPVTERGAFTFAGLLPGAYEVRVTSKSGWTHTLPADGGRTVNLDYAEQRTGVELGEWCPVSRVSGQWFDDLDGDGVRDPFEHGGDGRVIELVEDATGIVFDTTTTYSEDLDGDGAIAPQTEAGLYAFEVPLPGDYRVREALDGRHATYPWSHGPGDAPYVVSNEPDIWDDHGQPAIARASDGTSVVAWIHDQYRILAQIYGPDGVTVTEEPILIARQSKYLDSLDVAICDEGAFVVTWDRWRQNHSYARWFDPDGQPRTEIIALYDDVAENQRHPRVSMDGQGRTVVAWNTWGSSSEDGDGLFVRLFDGYGVPQGEAFRVHDSSNIHGRSVDVAASELGEFVVVWSHLPADPQPASELGRRFNWQGQPLGEEFEVYPENAYVRLDVSAQGRMAVLCSTENKLHLRALSATGSPMADTVEIDWRYAGRAPQAAIDGLGRMAVIYEAPDYNAYCQLVDAAGRLVGAPRKIGNPAYDQGGMSIDMDAAGRVAVAWAAWSQHDTQVHVAFLPGFSEAGSYPVVLSPGSVHAELDLASYHASVSGQVYEDIDRDGERDAGEPGLDGWIVRLVDSNTGWVVDRQVTAAADLNSDGAIDPQTESGLYHFVNPLGGRYEVRVEMPQDWFGRVAGESFPLISGTVAEDVNFPVSRGAAVTGRAFEDFDGDGAQDPGDIGLDGWTVELLDTGGETLATGTTASVDLDGNGEIDPESEQGRYAFEGLPPGEYQVRIVAPDGWVHTHPVPAVYSLSLAYAEQAGDKVFGLQALPSEIHGQKWRDSDADGERDPGEEGLDGWTIELVDAETGDVLATTVTASQDLDGDGTIDPETERGLYAFTGLVRGRYEVREVFQDGWRQTSPGLDGAFRMGPRIDVDPDLDGEEIELAQCVDGTFLAAWWRDGTLCARRFAADGTPLADTIHNLSGYRDAAVAPDGTFRLVWPNGPFLRVFDTDGHPLTGEIRVGESKVDELATACDAEGRTIVVWVEKVRWDQNGYSRLVWGRLVDADGTPDGEAFVVHEIANGFANRLAVAMNATGGFVITWSGGSSDSEERPDTWARAYRSDGAAVGPAVQVHVERSGRQDLAAPSIDARGRFVVAWYHNDQSKEIRARRFHADGTPAAEPFTIFGDLDGQYSPGVALLESGEILATYGGWELGDKGSVFAQYARLFGSDDQPIGEQALVAERQMYDPSLVFGPAGEFTVAYGERMITGRAGHVIPFDLAAGQQLTGDFSGYEIPVVAGQQFEDRNRNGVQDPDEPGLDGRYVEVVDADTGEIAACQTTRSMDLDGDGSIDPQTESGLYRIAGVGTGAFLVRQASEEHWVQFAPEGVNGHEVTLSEGSALVGLDFAMARPASVSGLVFEDLDGDARKDLDEPGLSGMPVELVDADSGEALATRDTDEDGAYQFNGLLPGDYGVRLPARPGWVQTVPDEGANGIALAYAEQYLAEDFGLHALPSGIRGQAFEDLNGNGARDAGEVGLDGRTVQLFDAESNTLVSEQLTYSEDLDGDGLIDPATESGLYAFTGLPRGAYEVREVASASYRQARPVGDGILPIGPAMQVNTTTEGRQERPAVARCEDGRYVVAWDSDAAGPPSYDDVFARVYNADGTPRTGEFQVNVHTDEAQYRPEVAMAPNGDFVIVWESLKQDGDSSGVYARRFWADGSAKGPEFKVNTHVVSSQCTPDVALAPDGRFTVTWYSSHQGTAEGEIYAQRYNADGTPDGGEFRVNTETKRLQLHPAVAYAPDGGSWIVWCDEALGDWYWYGLSGQHYHADGTPDGGQRKLNANDISSYVFRPTISMDAAGRFVVSWTNSASSYRDVTARRFLPDGTPMGEEFQVNTYAEDDQFALDSASDASGRFPVIWYGEPADEDVNRTYVRAYDAFGHPYGEESFLSPLAFGGRDGAIAVTPGGRIVAAFTGHDESGRGVFVQQFSLDGVYEIDLGVGETAEARDFADCPWAGVSGRVFDDLNANGMLDPGEPGLDGRRIELIDPVSGELRYATSSITVDVNADGRIDPETETGVYRLPCVLPGQYEVRQIVPDGWAATPAAGSHALSLVGGQREQGIHLGSVAGASLSGRVFEDSNGNAHWDVGEGILEGWTVELVDTGSGQVVAMCVTGDVDLNGDGGIDPADEAGVYRFADLVPGDYTLRQSVPSGWEQTHPTSSHIVSPAPGEQVQGLHFGNQPLPGEIRGTVWHDVDGDGTQGPNEPALPDWIVYVDINENNMLDAGEPSALSAADGSYVLADVPPGNRIVAQVVPAAWGVTYPRPFTESSEPGSQPVPAHPATKDNVARMIMNSGASAPVGVAEHIVTGASGNAVLLSEVPTSSWTYGCSATSAGMLFGYYDRHGYPEMYTGPGNGGLAPLSDLGGRASLIATAAGLDGRDERGHVDDYWIFTDAMGPDPYEDAWAEHAWGNCTADYMGTNQWKWDWDLNGTVDSNVDGATTFFYTTDGTRLYDYIPPVDYGLPQTALTHGLRLFAESRGYSVRSNYTQQTDNRHPNGFGFDEFMAEIDSGRPVMVQVTGHTMIGVGYDEDAETIYLHDTWGDYTASMDWGGDYAGMALEAVTVLQLSDPVTVSGRHEVTVTPGEMVGDVDFGNAQGSDIRGRKFEDLDGDGQRDAHEPGLDGWTIQLRNAAGTVLDTQLTRSIDLDGNGQIDPHDETGLYEFGNVTPGDYEVAEVTKALWVQNLPGPDAHSVSLADGEDIEELNFGNTFIPAPRVSSVSVQQGDRMSGDDLIFTATFDQVLDEGQLDASDFRLVGADNGPRSVRDWDYNAANSTLTVTFGDLPDDSYGLTLLSGDGHLENTYGWNLDGEAAAWPIPPHMSGDGREGGDFAVGFGWDCTDIGFPTPLEAVLPWGSTSYDGTVVGRIGEVADQDVYRVNLDSDQTLSVLLSADGALEATLSVYGPEGEELGTRRSREAGGDVLIQGLCVETSGEYAISVAGTAGTTGRYELRPILNAVVEEEEFEAGAGNDQLHQAQTLNGRFRSVEGADGTADAITVVGQADGWGTYTVSQAMADTCFHPNELQFAFADVPQVAGNGWIEVRALADMMDTDEYVDVYAEGSELARLFEDTGDQHGWLSASVPLGSELLGEMERDGVMSFTLVPSASVDDLGASTVELTLTYKSALSYNDFFRVSLSDREPLTLALAAPDPRDLGLHVLDAHGDMVAKGVTGHPNVDLLISSFLPERAGVYYVNVTGDEGAEYALAALRGADFDAETNDDVRQAQDITATRLAVGHVAETGLGRLFTYDAANRLIVEVDPEGGVVSSFPAPVGPAGDGGMAMATTLRSLLIAGDETRPIYELDPDTGATLRTVANPGLGANGLAFRDGEVFVLSHPRASVTLADYQFDVYGGRNFKYSIALTPGEYVCKLSQTQYDEAKALGLLAERVRFNPPTYEPDGNPDRYWLLVEDWHSPRSDMDYEDLEVLVEHLPEDEVRLTIWRGATSNWFDFVGPDDEVLVHKVPHAATVLQIAPERLLSRLTVLSYADGRVLRQFEVPPVDHGIAAASDVLVAIDREMVYSVDDRTGAVSRIGRVPGIDAGEGAHGLAVVGGELFVADRREVEVYSLPDLDHLRTLPAIGLELESLGGDEVDRGDFFRFAAEAGQVLDIRTFTPGYGGGEFVNVLDPALELYGPDGKEIAADDNGFDGRNARIVLPAEETGIYHVRVYSAANAGEYVLRIGEATGDLPEFVGSLVDPQQMEDMGLLPNELLVDFSDGVLMTTLQPEDLLVDGVAAASFLAFSGTRVAFNLPDGLDDRQHEITIPPGAILDLQGTPISGMYESLVVGQAAFPVPLRPVAPRGSCIYRGTAMGALAEAGDINRYTLTLDAGQTATVILRPEASLRSAVSVRGSGGELLGEAVAERPGSPVILQTIAIPSEDTLCLSVAAADVGSGGFELEVLLNAAAEGEDDGDAANDAHEAAQTIDGSFIGLNGNGSRGAAVGALSSASDEDWYRFTLQEGQNIAVVMSSWAPDVCELALVGPGGDTLLPGIGGSGDVSGYVNDFVAPESGDYYIRVSGESPAEYAFAVVRDGTFDLEGNNDLTAPQGIGEARRALGYLGAGERDVYGVSLGKGDRLVVAANQPASGPGEFVNGLKPRVEVFDVSDGAPGSGDPLDSAIGSLVYVAERTGSYAVCVSAAAGSGEYVLDLSDAFPASVAARHVLYNNSYFDGNDPSVSAEDDNAIAPDKKALLPGETATFASYTSYPRGLNGIMVDIQGLADPDGLTAATVGEYFGFKTGNDDATGDWAPGPLPVEVDVREGEGVNGSDRVTLIWLDLDQDGIAEPNEAVANQWLQVTVLANEYTGLPQEDVFYFGNAIGETGDDANDACVNAFDRAGIRDNPRTGRNPAPIDLAYDVNRDARVNAFDSALVRDNGTTGRNALKLITVPTAAGGLSSAALANTIGPAEPDLAGSAAKPGGGSALETTHARTEVGDPEVGPRTEDSLPRPRALGLPSMRQAAQDRADPVGEAQSTPGYVWTAAYVTLVTAEDDNSGAEPLGDEVDVLRLPELAAL